MTPEFLDSRIEAFLMRYADTLEKMSETEFEGHKRSVIDRQPEKLRNLDQE
jgi:insulysin